MTANDAFRPVTRYWDRIVKPEQVAQSLPLAVETMLDPADCGPAFIGLPQDVQTEAYDYPERLFEPRLHELRRPRPDRRQLAAAAEALRGGRRPLIVAGGGVHYSLAEEELAHFAEAHGLPVVETVAGKSSLVAEHPCYAGPLGVLGCPQANRLAADADVVLAIGTRLQDFTTGSWTVFGAGARIVALNVARFDATKHLAHPLVADALEGASRARRAAPATGARIAAWTERARQEAEDFKRFVAEATRPGPDGEPPSYAQVVGAVNRLAGEHDYALTASGGFPGELNANWLAKGVATFDCEYGFSCMGYEIAGAWGARMARPDGEVIAFRRRRLVPDAELRPAQLGRQRAQADRHRLRQRRLRGDRPASGGPGRGVVQQPVLRRRAARGRGGLGRPRALARVRGRGRDDRRRARGGVRRAPAAPTARPSSR